MRSAHKCILTSLSEMPHPFWQVLWPFWLVSHMPSNAFNFPWMAVHFENLWLRVWDHGIGDVTYHSRSGPIHRMQPTSAFTILSVFTWEEGNGRN